MDEKKLLDDACRYAREVNFQESFTQTEVDELMLQCYLDAFRQGVEQGEANIRRLV